MKKEKKLKKEIQIQEEKANEKYYQMVGLNYILYTQFPNPIITIYNPQKQTQQCTVDSKANVCK